MAALTLPRLPHPPPDAGDVTLFGANPAQAGDANADIMWSPPPQPGAPPERAPPPARPAIHPPVAPAPAPAAPAFTLMACTVGHGAGDMRILATALAAAGIAHKACENSASLAAAWPARAPDMVIVDVAPGGVDAVDTLFNLAERKYDGMVLLTGERGNAMVEGLARTAQRHALHTLPPVARPFNPDALRNLLVRQQNEALRHGPSKVQLEDGLKHNWIEFWYQPKIDLRSKRIVGVESFGRLIHPKIGLVPPNVFLRGASETDLFILGQHALIHAVKTASDFADLGLNVQVGINVSVRTLRTLPVALIIQTHHRNKTRKLRLTFDVNEADIIADSGFISQRARALRDLGVELAIDDFQSGRLSRTDLEHLAPAELKIPRLVVAGSDAGGIEARICHTIADVAHRIAARAVAVGVERASQATALVQAGCDIGQGFLFGDAMPTGELLQLMRQRSSVER